MMRITSTFVLAAALHLMSGSALAEETRFKWPAMDSKQCGYPAYPKASLRKEEEGIVFVGIQVDETGAVLDTKILLSSGSTALDDAAQLAFRKCRQVPGQVNGEPVTMWVSVQYLWSIEPSNGKFLKGLKQAALDGNAEARYLLGTTVGLHGKTEDERTAALKLVIIAAEAGDPMAQIALAAKYEGGKQIARDMDEARRWYGKAAAQGNIVAIDHLRIIGEPH
jgi:TonB family protein